ncbi:hypothetical protein PsYK624_066840 [Phanerochaete sordida]|uniref:Uncharacterized protein n=1 Tax=Phanerochaete sordida TaxID=48140 RepID=A0A9P3G760_9APHY|nr:hypothetical protein PsYK624_066840 [Phanerochaete sordida]
MKPTAARCSSESSLSFQECAELPGTCKLRVWKTGKPRGKREDAPGVRFAAQLGQAVAGRLLSHLRPSAFPMPHAPRLP